MSEDQPRYEQEEPEDVEAHVKKQTDEESDDVEAHVNLGAPKKYAPKKY